MKVLLVNGSPHKDGCTNEALLEIKKTLEENGIDSEIFWIGIKPLAGCTGCGQCFQSKRCIYNDVVNEFLDKVNGKIVFCERLLWIEHFMENQIYLKENLLRV